MEPPESPAIITKAPGTVVFEGKPITVKTSVKIPNLKYTVKDWLGKTLLQGDWPTSETRELTLGPLPIGYYVISTTSDSKIKLRDFSFTVVMDPKKRVFDHDSFFAVDSAQSWVARPGNFDCPYYDGDTYLLVSDLIYWAGIPHVRERLSWRGTQPTREKAPEYSYYMRNAQLLKERGILVSGMFHDSPGWADPIKKLPSNLVDVFNYCKTTSEAFGDRMGNWEFWNEQDIGFAPEPVWDYTAAMKAAYLGFRAANKNKIVANGAICTGAQNPYVHEMFNNDIAKYTDIYNFHTYNPPSTYHNLYKNMYELFEKFNMKGRAIWSTESGTNLEGHSDGDGVRKGLKAHSPEQEMILAEFFPKSQIAHMVNGCVRNYYFVFPPYNERNGVKDWGIMRRDGSVKPSYAAFSTMTAQLVSAKIQGEINIGEGLKAYVFDQKDGSQTLVFWSLSDVDTKTGRAYYKDVIEKQFTFNAPDGDYTLTNMVGTPSTVTAKDGKLQLTAIRFPAYIAGLKGLKADIPATPQGENQFYTPADNEDLTVILRIELDDKDFNLGGRKSLAELVGETGKLKLQVWNLEDKPKTGKLVVAGATLKGIPETIQLPAMGKVEYDVVLLPEGTDNYFGTRLTINGVFNGKNISKTTIPVTLTGLFLKNCRALKLDIENTKQWRRNDSANQWTCTYDEAEKAIRFDVVWTVDNDRWFYPEFILNLPEQSFANARFFQFEVKSCQDKVENDFNTQLVMAVEGTVHEHGKATYIGYEPPGLEWEQRSIPLSMFNVDWDKVGLVRIGANPKGKKLTFWIRNAKLLFEK